MINDIVAEQVELRTRLSSALHGLRVALQPAACDILISHNEVIDRHGVGALLQHIFATGRGFVSIRSRNQYGGSQTFGDHHFCLSYPSPDADGLPRLLELLGNRLPRRLLSAPYFPDDVLSTLALKTHFGVPLCTYVMDDQNVLVDNIPDALMQALLACSDIRFGISRELCEVYEAKYGLKFWFLPAVVPAHLVLETPRCPLDLVATRGVLLGNVWSQQWLNRLRLLTRTSGARIDWFGDPNREWLSFDEADLKRDGISFIGYVPEQELVQRLRQYAFAVLPTASSGDAIDRPELARLSLPSRVSFLTAVAHTPIIVLGRTDSAAARFLQHLEIGVVSSYRPDDFLAAVKHVCQNDVQLRMRQRSAQVARTLSAEGIAEWIWTSLDRGEPADSRFEDLMPRGQVPTAVPLRSDRGALQDASVIVTMNEVTPRHGTGALVHRIFAASENILSIRSFDHYGGDHLFGDVSLCWNHAGLSRPELFRRVADALQESTVRRIVCVPYAREDVLTAIAVKDIYGVPLAAYIMDDQNVTVQEISDSLMQEFLEKCSLRLATHPELRDAYEKKFGLKFWLLPAVVPDRLISEKPAPLVAASESLTGALLGSLWSERWFSMLWQTASRAGVALDWYGNSQYPWLHDSVDELRRKGLDPQGLLQEDLLAERLKTYPFVVVPAGTLDERDDRLWLGLSLPGRIIFAMATANTPIVVLGSPDTSAARFVRRFAIGDVCDYEPTALRQTVERITQPDVLQQIRSNAARVAREFSDAGIAQWVWDSLERGEPADLRFERLMPRVPRDLVPFIEAPVPADIYRDFIPVYHVMRRLRLHGVRPDFVVDVGSSHGIWSYSVSKVFPEARFILIDPLMSRYDRRALEYFSRTMERVELLELAVSNRQGRTAFQVSDDLWGSSLLDPADFRSYEHIEVEVDTLDNVARQKHITGRGLLKLDVQCAEHLVLEGARELLTRIDGVVVEVSLVRYDPRALVYSEMLRLLEGLGYRYYDETGLWRSPVDGTLLQREILFLRSDLCIPKTSRDIAV